MKNFDFLIIILSQQRKKLYTMFKNEQYLTLSISHRNDVDSIYSGLDDSVKYANFSML